jgi:pseudouridine-5'-phosphate glycosidase
MNAFVSIHPEVRAALDAGAAVVALESTIISHGMPYPTKVETAREVAQVVRDGGAVPATIAVSDGRIRVGLSSDQLETLGKAENVRKVSRRDLPFVVASGEMGATTVAGTMICAKLAGIRVFVTGGIGGVHRQGENTMDVSADLTELAHTSVAVVCAGAKAILDLPRTLEVLETHGVPVIGHQTDTFPAFYSRSSGLPVDARLDDAHAVAEVMAAKWALGLEGGVLVTTPVPREHAMASEEIDAVIEQSLAEADRKGIRGKDVTPFLLANIVQRTGGRSLETNVALVKNNARLGAAIAVAYAKLTQGRSPM